MDKVKNLPEINTIIFRCEEGNIKAEYLVEVIAEGPRQSKFSLDVLILFWLTAVGGYGYCLVMILKFLKLL